MNMLLTCFNMETITPNYCEEDPIELSPKFIPIFQQWPIKEGWENENLQKTDFLSMNPRGQFWIGFLDC